MKKGVMTTARLVNDRLQGASIRWRPVMVTLTYADAAAWRPDHITDFMRRVHMFAKRRGLKLPYVWVAELQKRGAVHYHVLLWVPARMRVPYADRQGWWNHGSTNIIRVKNAVGYVAKYASKFESKDADFPKGMRLHGIGGITALEKRVVAWWKLPKDLRQGSEGSVVWRRAPGGGWLNPETGERRLPEWEMAGHSETWRHVEMIRSPLSVEQLTWRSYFKEQGAGRRQEVAKRLGQKTDQTDRRSQIVSDASEMIRARIWWETKCRVQSWAAQLAADRVAWVLDVESALPLTPGA